MDKIIETKLIHCPDLNGPCIGDKCGAYKRGGTMMINGLPLGCENLADFFVMPLTFELDDEFCAKYNRPIHITSLAGRIPNIIVDLSNYLKER